MSMRRVALAVTAALVLLLMPAAIAAAAPIGAFTTKGAWSFVSAPGLHPPKLGTTGHVATGQLARGDFLVANFPYLTLKGPMTGQSGPLIIDRRLGPVWFRSVGTSVVAGDLQQETFNGKPVLVWWQGVVTRTGATQSGEVEIVDQHYRKVASVKAQGPAGCRGSTCWQISIHDAAISGNDIWVTVYRNVAGQNLRRYGGSSHGTVYDVGVQEYSLANPHKPTLVNTWDALNPGSVPNVPLSESEQPAAGKGTGLGGSWDAYHINAVQVLPNGELLVTMRNTWAAYLIDANTGHVVWTLGGKASSFRSPASARFEWPHHAQLLPSGEVTLFDDNCCKLKPSGKFAKPRGPARGLVLKLDQTAHTASLVARYAHSPNLVVSFLGSMQLLPGSRALVGWGNQPFFSEYSKSGRQLLDVHFPRKDLSYRALFTSSWVGTPFYPPSSAIRTIRGQTIVYASWNGATRVARWQVLGGSSASHLRRVASSARTGFETAISLGRHTFKVIAVRAVDSRGRLLGSRLVHGGRRGSSGLPQSY
jgi:hypothetical protein